MSSICGDNKSDFEVYLSDYFYGIGKLLDVSQFLFLTYWLKGTEQEHYIYEKVDIFLDVGPQRCLK